MPHTCSLCLTLTPPLAACACTAASANRIRLLSCIWCEQPPPKHWGPGGAPLLPGTTSSGNRLYWQRLPVHSAQLLRRTWTSLSQLVTMQGGTATVELRG